MGWSIEKKFQAQTLHGHDFDLSRASFLVSKAYDAWKKMQARNCHL